MPNLIGNLPFEYLDKFQHIVLQFARKLNPNFFRKGILQIKWVSFYDLKALKQLV